MRNTLFFLTLLFMCYSCGESQQQRDRRQVRQRQVSDSLALKVAVMPTLDCMPLFVAHETGIFDSLGVDVRLRQYHAQMDCDTALAGGSVQGAVTDLVRAERLQRRGTRLVYKTATDAYWQLVSNRKQRIKELSDLGDKMIAMTRYSATDLMATHAMAKAKLKTPAFKVQVNDVLIRLDMLRNNEMDATVLTEPQAAAARVSKHPVLLSTRDEDWRLGVVVFRTNDIADNHRSRQLELFMKAYDTACDSLNKRGLNHYASVMEKYCHTDRRTLRELGHILFTRHQAPRQKDVDTARRWLNTLEK